MSPDYYEDLPETINKYCDKVDRWLQNVRDIDEKSSLASSTTDEILKMNNDDAEPEDDDNIGPDDNAPQVSSRTGYSSKSSLLRRAELVRLKELEAQVAILQEQQRIEEEELKPEQRQLNLKFEREKLKLQSEIADSMISHNSTNSTPKESKVDVKRMDTKDDLSKPKLKSDTANYSHKIFEEQNKICKEIIHHQQRIGLPQRQTPTFDGNPLQYRSFIRAFETLIEAKEPDPASELYFLEKYTSGRVQELVRSYLHISDPHKGYSEARSLLERRFGDSYKIAMDSIEKLTSGHQIRADDAYALESFSITLSSCKNSLEAIGYLRRIDNPEYMKKIIEKLPYKLQERWRDVVDVIMNEKMRDVTIDDITEFVEKQSRSLNNPIFRKTSQGQRPSYSQATPKSHARQAPKASFSINVSQPNKGDSSSSVPASEVKRTNDCVVCDNDHQITECPQFKSMDLKERLDVVKKKDLCFGCLRRGHQLRTCYKRKPCRECNRKHFTFLHSNTTDDNKKVEAPTKDKAAQ